MHRPLQEYCTILSRRASGRAKCNFSYHAKNGNDGEAPKKKRGKKRKGGVDGEVKAIKKVRKRTAR